MGSCSRNFLHFYTKINHLLYITVIIFFCDIKYLQFKKYVKLTMQNRDDTRNLQIQGLAFNC